MEKNNSASDASANRFHLRNANIVLPDRILNRASLLIRDDRIVSVQSKDVPQELDTQQSGHSQTLDLGGLTVFPGMVDVHIHGAVGVDTMSATSDHLDRVSRFLAANGVTSWLPTLVPASASDYQSAVSAIEALMKEQASQAPQGARILGVHYEGPFVNKSQCGALHPAYFKSFQTAADIDALPVPHQLDAIRMMTVAPEIEGGVRLIEELVKRGWIVSIGHTRANLAQLEGAFEAGAHHMTHFMNAMPPFHHRAPGPVGWGLTKKEVSVDVIADGIHLDPLVLKLLVQTKGAGSTTLISDAIAAAGTADGDYQIWGETISVKDGRTSNVHGTIAGSVITMLDAMRMMRSLGVLDLEIAKMASTNPARLLGLEQLGSVEEGKYADLVALDQQGNVRLTLVGGSLVFTGDI